MIHSRIHSEAVMPRVADIQRVSPGGGRHARSAIRSRMRSSLLYSSMCLALAGVLLVLAQSAASAFVIEPLKGGIVAVTLTVTADTVEAAQQEAILEAVRANIGRTFWGSDLIVARDLLTSYIEKSGGKFITAIDTLKTDFVEGKPKLELRVFVDYNALEKDLKEKRFVYTPRVRPYFAVFLAEKLGEEYAKYTTGRSAVTAAFQDRNLRPYEGILDTPPSNNDVASDPILLEDALIACEKRGIELLISGSTSTKRDVVKDIYYDTFFFYTTDIQAVMVRVDTREELARVKARGSAADRDEQQAIDLSIRRAATLAVNQMADKFEDVWGYMVLDKADYRILLTGITPKTLTLVKNSIAGISRDTKVFLRQQYDRSAVLAVVYPGSREDLVKAISTTKYPTLGIIPAPILQGRLEGSARTTLAGKYDVVKSAGLPADSGRKDIYSYRYETTMKLRMVNLKSGLPVAEITGRGEASDLNESNALIASWRQALIQAMADLTKAFPKDYVGLNLEEAVYTTKMAKAQRPQAAQFVRDLELESPLSSVSQESAEGGVQVIQKFQVRGGDASSNLLGKDPLLPDTGFVTSPQRRWLEIQVGE